MCRVLVLAALALVSGCRDEDVLAPYLGPYYGGFDTAMTADPSDDLNPNQCAPGEDRALCLQAHGDPLSHLLMKLDRNAAGELTIAFFRGQAEFEAGSPIYLSEGCRTSLGPSRDLELHRIDESLDETQLLATASFPLQFGNQVLECTNSARLGAGRDPAMELSLQVNPVSGANAISITLEKSRRDGDYLYVKKDGEKVPVKLDLRHVGTDAGESRRLCAADGETTIESKDGTEAVCVMTGRRQWQVVLPLSPWGPGVTAFWGSTLTPTWYRTSDEPDVVTFHRALFLPVQLEDDAARLAPD
ncbi:MAG: hypothetical protein ACRCVD_03985 [Halioglobus sp.]